MPKTWTVDRKTWYRGKGAKHSRLRRAEDGMMCCLGSRAIACGLTPEQITELESPYSLNLKGLCGDQWESFLNSHHTLHSLVGLKIMNVNDDACIDDKTREYTLTALFETIGETVEFIG